jgi:CRISPR-associated protein Cas1
MAWRGLHISRPCRLSLADNQCVVAQDDGETRLPIEDLAWIVLDTQQALLSAALASACMQAGVAIIVTDTRHHPNGLLLPFHRHHRQAEIAAFQISLTDGPRHQLWQAIVRAKIRGQAAVLALRGANPRPLIAMADRVSPGDPENVEARAARHYWSTLFADFTRADETDLRNAMLNYGYAVMRAAVARALVAAGLLPAFGIHHAGALNPFNLADDLLEVFRPLVDHLVWRLAAQEPSTNTALTVAHRQALAGVVLETMQVGSERMSALAATESAAVSLARAMEFGRADLLVLPELYAPP